MDAKEYLKIALGGNINTGTLTSLAISEIMEDYAKYIKSLNDGGCCAVCYSVDYNKNNSRICSMSNDGIISSTWNASNCGKYKAIVDY